MKCPDRAWPTGNRCAKSSVLRTGEHKAFRGACITEQFRISKAARAEHSGRRWIAHDEARADVRSERRVRQVTPLQKNDAWRAPPTRDAVDAGVLGGRTQHMDRIVTRSAMILAGAAPDTPGGA